MTNFNYKFNESSENLNNKLKENGFVIIKNVYSNNDLDLLKKSMNLKQKKVNYPYLKEKIETIIYPKLKQKLNWKNPISAKWRFSNKTNSSDAGFFHRDIKYYNFDENIPDVYTVLTYMDSGTMEVIPKTHKKEKLSIFEVIPYYFKEKKIKMEEGDLLIIHSNILHRGIFYNHKKPNRRLLQMFNTYSSTENYRKYHKNNVNKPYEKSTLIQNSLTNSKLISKLQKFEFFNKFFGIIVYFFAAIRSLFAHIFQMPKNIDFLFEKKILFCSTPAPKTNNNIDNDNMYYYNVEFNNIN
jgi:hypothetical protein